MKELMQEKKQIFEIKDLIGNTSFEYFLSCRLNNDVEERSLVYDYIMLGGTVFCLNI